MIASVPPSAPFQAGPVLQDWARDELLTQGVLPRRILAWWIDLFVVGALVLALWLVMFLFGLLTLGLGFPIMGILPLVPLAYHWGFLAGPNQATPGQAVMGLVVVRNADLGRPTVAEAAVFTLLFYLTLAIGGLLLAVALFTTRRRTLHDLGAGLVVVRKRALIPAAAAWNMPGGSMA